MKNKWCVWDVELQEVFLREHRGRGFSYQRAKSLATAAHKRDGSKYEARKEPED